MPPTSPTLVFFNNEELYSGIKNLNLTGKIRLGKQALGTGAHSDVFKGVYHKGDGTAQDVAVKRLRFVSGGDEYTMVSF